jgi:hypothetical protein
MCNIWKGVPAVSRVEDAARRFCALLQSANVNAPAFQTLPRLATFFARLQRKVRKNV